MDDNKCYTDEDYLKIHNLAYQFKDGDQDSGLELIELFSPFLNRYVSLLFYGYFNLEHYSIKNFIKLFINNKKARASINSYKAKNIGGYIIARNTVDKIQSFFDHLDITDIQNDIKYIFLNMAKKYNDKEKPSFHNYINKNFHFYAFRYFEKNSRDPLSRNFNQYDLCIDKEHDSSYDLYIEDIEYNISINQDIKNNNKVILNIDNSKKNENIYNDSFIDINWINGITCNEIFKVLNPFERKIIKYWYVDKNTDIEIGKMFGVIPSTISVRRSSAKKKLENEMKKRKFINK